MGAYTNATMSASFNARMDKSFTPENHLKLGGLSDGLFWVSKNSIKQYARIKNKLLKIDGIGVLTLPCHHSNIRLNSNVMGEKKNIKNILKQLLESLSDPDEKEILSEISAVIGKFTGVVLSHGEEQDRQATASLVP